MRYGTEEEIDQLVEDFEKGRVVRGEWGHPEHLVVAFRYAQLNDFDSALSKIRCGIMNLLRVFKVDLAQEMPYNETLTVFWMREISRFAAANGELPTDQAIAKLINTYDKFYPLRFYTEELLFSEEAKSGYVEPDIAPH